MSAARDTVGSLPLDLPSDVRTDADAAREKSPGAFRTISEVSDDLDIPSHVLRFWETKFPQLSPMKRGGGRRYYRPADVALLRGIRTALYDEGLTIKGLQKLFRERGARHVAGMADGASALQAPMPEVVPGQGQRLEALISELVAVRDRLRSA